jgi:hypothetical protein
MVLLQSRSPATPLRVSIFTTVSLMLLCWESLITALYKNMAHHAVSSVHLDPEHTSCIGGRTVLTCRSCAGNAPRFAPSQAYTFDMRLSCLRGAICSSCSGRGFNVFICVHCNPVAAAVAVRSAASLHHSTPGSSENTSPASLSRSSSTSMSSQNGTRQNRTWRRFDDGDDHSGGGSVGNTPRRS